MAFMKSIDVLIIVVFGGIGSTTGAVVSAVVLGILNMYLQGFSRFAHDYLRTGIDRHYDFQAKWTFGNLGIFL